MNSTTSPKCDLRTAIYLFIVGVMALWLAVMCCGCSSFYSRTEAVDNVGKPVTITVRISTLFDSKSEITRLLVHQTTRTNGIAAQSTGIASLDQQSTATNINDVLSAVVGAAVRAAVGK
jgi:hypothetical protein